MNTEIDKKVIGRFYEALEVIISRRAVGGIQPYCELYGIDKRNLYAQRKNPDHGSSRARATCSSPSSTPCPSPPANAASRPPCPPPYRTPQAPRPRPLRQPKNQQ